MSIYSIARVMLSSKNKNLKYNTFKNDVIRSVLQYILQLTVKYCATNRVNSREIDLELST